MSQRAHVGPHRYGQVTNYPRDPTMNHLQRPPELTERTAPQPGEPIGLLDVHALAERLGVTPRFIRRLVHERRVPFLKLGKFVRFDRREIDEWIDECRRPPTVPLR